MRSFKRSMVISGFLLAFPFALSKAQEVGVPSNSAFVLISEVPTNIFLTDDDEIFLRASQGLGAEMIPRKKLVEALKALECRPADSDPGGHWGFVVEGCQLSLRLVRTNFFVGEPIQATILLRNVGTNTIHCDWPLDDLTAVTWLRTESNQRSQQGYPDPRPGSRWGRAIRPRTQRQFSLGLARMLPTDLPGTFVVSVRTRVDKTSGHGWVEVSSGEATIKIEGTEVPGKAANTTNPAKASQ